MLELGHRDVGAVEIFRVGPRAHHGAGAPRVLPAALGLQFLHQLAAFEGDRVLRAVAIDVDLEARRQRVGHRDADAVQAAGDVVHGFARFRELAAGVQHRERDFDRGLFFHRVHVDRDAAALVLDLDRAVLAYRNDDFLAEAGQRLVDGVVDRLLHDVQRMDRVGVHARHAPDGLQPLQGLDRGSVVNGFFGHCLSA